MKTLILTGGGTAGHCIPALALLPELRKHFDKIIYIGSKDGIEKDLATEAGLDYYSVPTVKFERKFTLKNLTIPITLFKGISNAKKLLRNINPSVVFSKGGYVSLPTVIAAKELNIPVVSHESDMTVGLANKIGSKYSTLFLTSFDCTNIDGVKTVYTGSPINPKLFEKKDKNALLKKYGFSGRKKILLITGGSSGSKNLNEITQKCLYKLIKRYDVIHLCGKGKKSNVKQKGYFELEFTNNIDELFFISDLVVSRAGANALFELTTMGKPTLLVPLPKGNSRGDQVDNAKYFEKRKMVNILYEEDMTEDTFYSAVCKLECNANYLTENCKKSLNEIPNKKIAELIFKVANSSI